LATVSGPAAAAGANVTFSFAQGLTPNTDYIVTLIARDATGNCQQQFTTVGVHTADNIPPVTLALDVTNVTGTSAELHLQLDEPGTALFVVDAASSSGGLCPSADEMFGTMAAQPAPQAAAAGAATAGSLLVPQRAPAVAVQPLPGLTSETAYFACVVAQDATQLRNRQSTVQRVDFTTLDITPPTVTVTLAGAADGDVACSHDPPYLCSLTWKAALSEAGAAHWVLLHNNSSAPLAALPTAVALLSQSPAQLFPSPQATAVMAQGNLSFPPSPSAAVQLTGLPSKASYLLVVAPRDNAVPTPNVPAAATVVAVTAPDVQPPTFLQYGLSGANDAALIFTVALDEAGITAYVLLPSPSVTPRATDVFGGQASNGTALVSTGNFSCSTANTSTSFTVGGLKAGVLYDLHMAAVDTANNRQPNVTTIRWVSLVSKFRCK
jgi:hypothetical protein